jgi:hypothetical protein
MRPRPPVLHSAPVCHLRRELFWAERRLALIVYNRGRDLGEIPKKAY